jgi:HSP20 family molecular chaperone IbpA
MSRVSLFQSPLLLGFDGLEQMLERATKGSSDGYPPYNIERHPPQSDGTETYCIQLAVAGFSRADLDITLEDNQLNVRGRQKEEAARDYLHRGIAARQFAKAFLLAEGMEIQGATLEHGLLAIHLRKSAPDKRVRRIEISE